VGSQEGLNLLAQIFVTPTSLLKESLAGFGWTVQSLI
jgi:hypothetical protein